MRLDMKHALRHVLCLPNPSHMQVARWARLDMSHALRHDECLPNPSALAGVRWGGASVDMKHAPPRIVWRPQVPPIYQTQVSTSLPAEKCLKSLTDSRV